MRKSILLLCIALASVLSAQTPSFENQFARPLSRVLNDLEKQFNTKFTYDIDTVGKMLPYADSRIRPYSLEESLRNVLSYFDYKYVTQHTGRYKLKRYEYPRRVEDDGVRLLAHLNSLYADKASFEGRKDLLKKEVRRLMRIDEALALRVPIKPVVDKKIRKFDGYTVQNFYLETLPGLYVCGSIYAPSKKGEYPFILCPNGHFPDGRYREDQQQRMATFARMGAVAVDFDLFGWGESVHQVGAEAHRTSVSQIVQALNGLTILDYMLTRPDVDPTRVGLNGGSGGGSQVVTLSMLDDRFTAASPVVNLSAYFDGGCPCESGMPIFTACGGTCNPELMALFAPRPLLVVSEGRDWTRRVDVSEYPYLQRIYGFYGAKDRVSNIHLPQEGHDFGPSKRNAVYAFFAKELKLNAAKIDESRITIEPYEAMYSWGKQGEAMPIGAIKNILQVQAFFDADAARQYKADASMDKKAADWSASLNLNDAAKTERVRLLIRNHLIAVRDFYNNNPYTNVPEGICPFTGRVLTKVDRQIIINSTMPKEIHSTLMEGLRKELTEEQVVAILDKYTVGKVAFTFKSFSQILAPMSQADSIFIMNKLMNAREQAIDYKNMEMISAIFKIAKNDIERYVDQTGRDWRKTYKRFVDKLIREKEAKKKQEQTKK